METTTVSKTHTREAALAAVKYGAIAITFGFLYYMMVMYSPVLAKSSLAGLLFGNTLRLANMLKAWMYVTPAAIPGIFMGAVALNASEGFVGMINPIMLLVFGLSLMKVSKVWGRSTAKDLTLLAIYGALTAISVSIEKAGLVFFMTGEGWQEVFVSLFTFKLLTSMLIHMAGYPFVRAYENMRGKIKHGESNLT